MNHINKFHLTEFLKTQRYYIPIMILLLQLKNLDYKQIFIIYAAQNLIVFLLEIPTGIVADRYGKKSSLVFSRLILIPAYIMFYYADSFWTFFVAMLFLGLNKAFKSGTHKAYIYDYLSENKKEKLYTKIIGKNKFYSRIGEGGASAVGGIIAAKFGINTVFLVALIPAFINLIISITYKNLKTKKHKISAKRHTIDSLKLVWKKNTIFRLMANSAIFLFALDATEKLLQPYLKTANLPLEYFGFVYTIIFIIAAFSVKYSDKIENKYNTINFINHSMWLPIMLLLILNFKYVSLIAISFFALFQIIKGVRRTIIITELNNRIPNEKRATLLSVDSLFEALAGLILLPLLGYISDNYEFFTGFGFLAIVLILNQIFFWIKNDKSNNTRN